MGLESRQLRTSGVTAAMIGGILAVHGTDGDDLVHVRVRPEGPRGRDVLQVEGVTPRPVLAARVRLVVVFGGEGDDILVMDDLGRGTVPVWFEGGPGNNALVGGGANDVLIAGDGNNVILGNGNQDHIVVGSGFNVINGVPSIPPDLGPVESDSDLAVGEALELEARELIEATNATRQRAGLTPLTIAPALMEAARLHAESMARFNQLDHELPDSKWPTLRDRADHVGYDFAKIGENLAFNHEDGRTVVDGWMESAGHRSNLLQAEFTEIGVAVARNAIGQPYYVQVLAKPMVRPQ